MIECFMNEAHTLTPRDSPWLVLGGPQSQAGLVFAVVAKQDSSYLSLLWQKQKNSR